MEAATLPLPDSPAKRKKNIRIKIPARTHSSLAVHTLPAAEGKYICGEDGAVPQQHSPRITSMTRRRCQGDHGHPCDPVPLLLGTGFTPTRAAAAGGQLKAQLGVGPALTQASSGPVAARGRSIRGHLWVEGHHRVLGVLGLVRVLVAGGESTLLVLHHSVQRSVRA